MTDPTPAALSHARRRQQRLIAWLHGHATLLAYEAGTLSFRWDREGMSVEVRTIAQEAVPEVPEGGQMPQAY